MKIEQLMQNISDNIKSGATVKNVFGEPIKLDENKTLIPVAKICFGFGAGSKPEKNVACCSESTEPKNEEEAKNSGGGGGGTATPIGVIVSTPDSTIFMPFFTKKKLMFSLFFGMIIGFFLALILRKN